jgi:hypothetical protein
MRLHVKSTVAAPAARCIARLVTRRLSGPIDTWRLLGGDALETEDVPPRDLAAVGPDHSVPNLPILETKLRCPLRPQLAGGAPAPSCRCACAG